MKKVVSILLIFCLSLSFVVAGNAVSGGRLGDGLSWSYDGSRLRITGSDKAIPDFSQNAPAPWDSIAGNVFYLSLPASLESIGNYAFFGCANLKAVDFPDRLQSIGDYAFRDSGLESLTLPYNLHTVGTECFAGCTDLESVDFKVLASGGMGVEKVDGLEQMGEGAFAFCTSLKSLQLPVTLKAVADRAFEQCAALSAVTFAEDGKNLKSIGREAFSYCDALSSFTIPENITVIREAAFRGTALTSVKLHKGITAMEDKAFYNCDSLTKIDVLNKACTFADSAMTTPDGAKLYFEYGAKAVLDYAEKYGKPYSVLCVGRTASHAFKKSITKASGKADGKIGKRCSSCAYTVTTPIARIKTVKLTKTAFTYNGKIQYPTASQVQVKDAEGKTISGTCFTVSRVKSTDGKKVGQHAVKITFKGNYEGSFTRYYQILPKGTAVKAVAAGKGSLKVTWSKQTTQTTGYQIRLCKNNRFSSGVKIVTIKNNKSVTQTVGKLSRKTGYYIQIRTYKTVSGKHYFSAWSKSFGRKTK